MTDVNELYCARHLFDKRTEATHVHFIERCIHLIQQTEGSWIESEDGKNQRKGG